MYTEVDDIHSVALTVIFRSQGRIAVPFTLGSHVLIESVGLNPFFYILAVQLFSARKIDHVELLER